MTTSTPTKLKTFFPFPIESIDYSKYTQIDFNAARWSYLIINHDSGTYYQTTLLAGLMDKVRRLYGYDAILKESGQLHYCIHKRYVTLYPSKITINDDGTKIEILLVKNLMNSELQNKMRKRGLMK